MATNKSNKFGSSAQFKKPDGEVRQSQLITTFGPGALVDLVNDAAVVSGLEFWHYPEKFRVIDEPRLRDDLIERFQRTGRKLDAQKPFRAPPTGDMREPHPGCGVDALEFPRWFVCQNARCRALVRSSDGLERKKDRYVHDCDSGRPAECVPVRFVAACKEGHLDEFPWVRWVHERSGVCASPRLRLHDGATGDFSEVKIECVCRASRPLLNAVVDAANPKCEGRRPWLGSEGSEPCDENVHLLTRTGSDAYYAQVESALSIPEAGLELREAVQSHWDVLENVVTAEDWQGVRKFAKKLAALDGYAVADVLATIADIRDGAPAGREPLRVSEYRQLIAATAESPGELPDRHDVFHARRLIGPTPPKVRSVILCKKLRQVRAQVGFTRLQAATANLQGEFDLEVQSAPLSLTRDWLPATEILGEGIFIELDEDAVHAWESSPAVVARVDELRAGFVQWKKNREGSMEVAGRPKAGLRREMEFPGARFYLLHSLSHLLMTALSLECGYPASSLSERLYCADHNSALPMAGVLLLTGSPSAEGTLGGLVDEGRRLKGHLKRALQAAALCSHDPVCAQHSPKGDLAERHLEGAACHGCLYVAESSCERFNGFLDRALVVPTLGDQGCAFFAASDGDAP